MAEDTPQRIERSVRIASTSGLHARPAALFSQAAAEQSVEVMIARPGGDPVPARSILMLLTLGADQGDEVILSADGEGAAQAVATLAALLEKNLDEES